MLLLCKQSKGVKLKLNSLLISAIFGVMFFINGCASRDMQAKNSGFFKDYQEFENSYNSDGSMLQSSPKSDMSKYRNILVTPVEVISAIEESKQTDSQKKLYKQISDYLTAEYKNEIEKSTKYKLTQIKGSNTLKLESAISTVEVHFDDKRWNQLSPISMGITVVSYNSYLDEDVRLLYEKRLVDSVSGEVLERSINIVKDKKIVVENDYLDFKDFKLPLDSLLSHIKKQFSK